MSDWTVKYTSIDAEGRTVVTWNLPDGSTVSTVGRDEAEARAVMETVERPHYERHLANVVVAMEVDTVDGLEAAGRATDAARLMTNTELADTLVDHLMHPANGSSVERVAATFEAVRRLTAP